MHIDEVRNNQFFQFPQWILKEPYNALSDKAKLMYMLLFDRRTLSEKNNWYDENGRVYMYFTIEQFMQELSCSRQTIINAKKELQKIGLLEEIRQGVNKPNIMYINGSLNTRLQEVQKLDRGSLNTRLQEVQKLDGINTNITNTNITNTSTAYSPSENSSVFDYYQQRIGALDGYQYESLNQYMTVDGLEPELVKRAISRAADNSKRSFGYINSILKSWSQNGIKTIAQQDEEQRKFDDGKADRFQNGKCSKKEPDKPKYGGDWFLEL
ncbi:replication initiator protein A [Streptococcus sp. 20-1249]|uniref:replication initiator protein A n=1 Tax=Streptococcus hepaticus TaxID=3349163 RepID=UPI0037479548